jgi:predicted nucleotidyltransferase component of viral defense system
VIGRGEITKVAQAAGIDAQTVERDYLLAHVAVEVAGVGGKHLVLKGGTCLRLAHYSGYRYSADLDYSIRDIDPAESLGLIANALDTCRERLGLSHLQFAEGADPPRIEYVGPLGAKPRTIKLDLADDELVIGHAELPLVVDWRDVSDGASIRGYTLTEICAEKLRCVIQRRQCRDVYDLWSVLDDQGHVDLFEVWHRFEEKANHRGLDPMRFFDRWEEGTEWYGERWTAELADYLGEDCPDFASVSRAIERRVTELRDYLD